MQKGERLKAGRPAGHCNDPNRNASLHTTPTNNTQTTWHHSQLSDTPIGTVRQPAQRVEQPMQSQRSEHSGTRAPGCAP